MALLKDNPGLNVNFDLGGGWSYLHTASFSGHAEVMKVLLAYPDINVNVKDNTGSTPVSCGCRFGRLSVVKLLLKDPRVDLTFSDDLGRTALWWASKGGYLEVIEWLIASRRALGDLTQKGIWGSQTADFTAIEIARLLRRIQVAQLLERFVDNPTQTRHELRVEFGILYELAAELYAVIVFLCDDLLQLKPACTSTTCTASATFAATTRFFEISSKLPMELQMILCHRAFGSMKQNILLKDSEAAFKSLAGTLILEPSRLN